MNERMGDEEILNEFERTEAIRKGHFILTSGLHSDTYFQCARVLESPSLTARLAAEGVARLPKDLKVDLVASPAVGGILYGFAVALALDKNLIFSERQDGKMVFRRSFEVPKGANVLVCEDVVTTGGSVKEVCDLIEEAGGKVCGVMSLVDRGTDRKFDAPFYPLLTMHVDSWTADQCALCKEGIEVYAPGSRHLAK